MPVHPRMSVGTEARSRIIEVAAGRVPADLVIRGGRVLNVVTGSVDAADIAIVGGRIAAVGSDVGRGVDTIDLRGAIVTPGLIDPHAHADLTQTPSAFADEAVRHGTTLAVVDGLGLVERLSDADVLTTCEQLLSMPLKYLWALVPSRHGLPFDEVLAITGERLSHLMAVLPGVSGSGELSAWPDLIAGDRRITDFVHEVGERGLRVDGHMAGASVRTLATLVAAGVESDHEAINGPELAERIRLGLWTMIRHSSLRRDARSLGRALVDSGLPRDRVMLTADGILPEDLVGNGHIDAVVREVVAGGVDPASAVRMATLHPATYHKIDSHVGLVAPGRCADLVIVDSLQEFHPRAVFADGRLVEDAPSLGAVDWSGHQLDYVDAGLTGQQLVERCEAGPRLRLESVIAYEDRDLVDDSQRVFVALVMRDASAIVAATMSGIDVRAFASSHTGARDVFLIGNDPSAIVQAYRRVVALGGGMAVPGAEVPLSVLGTMFDGTSRDVASRSERLRRLSGVGDGVAPLPYLSLFLTEPVMPGVVLTAHGVMDVRSRRVLAAPSPLRAIPVN